MGTLKLQSTGPLYSNTVIGIHWPLMSGLLHLVQRGGAWAGCGPAQSPPRCTKCSSPLINGQCTNFILFDVALQLPLRYKGLITNTVLARRHINDTRKCRLAYLRLHRSITRPTAMPCQPLRQFIPRQSFAILIRRQRRLWVSCRSYRNVFNFAFLITYKRECF